MKIALYTPELTIQEAKRFWMTAEQICDLSAIGDSRDPKIKKLLNTLSDRGHVPFVKSGTAKTSPRLYSLVSAAMLRVIYEITRDGRTYNYAQPVADMVRDQMIAAIGNNADIGALEQDIGVARIMFSGIDATGGAARVKWSDGEIAGGLGLAFSVLDAGYMIWRIIDLYPDWWWKDLVARGVVQPDDPVQIGVDGWPVEGGT